MSNPGVTFRGQFIGRHVGRVSAPAAIRQARFGLVALVLATTFIACAAQAKTVTIGTGSGDLSYPTAQTTLGLDPGDTLYINSGTYASFKLSNLAGTAEAPIIVQCDPNTVFSTTAGFKSNTFDNVAFVEFHDFRYETYASPLMVFTGDSHDVLFKGFHVYDTTNYNFRAHDVAKVFDGTRDSTFYNFAWRDCTFESNAGSVYMAAAATAGLNNLTSLLLDFEVVGCTFSDYADGTYNLFSVGKAFNFEMRECSVDGFANDGTYNGHNSLVFGSGYFHVHHNVFRRHWANDVRVTPVKLNALGYDGPDAVNRFYNNLIYDKAKYPAYCHRDADQDDLDNSGGYYSRTSSEVYFNTMYRSRAVNYVGTLVTVVGPNITIKDNLIVEPECDTTFDPQHDYVCNWGSGTRSNVTVDNNLVFGTLAASGLEDAVDFVPGESSDALDAASGTVNYITDDLYDNERYVGAAADVGAVEQQVSSSGLLGDFTGNGVVDQVDYTMWADRFGQPDSMLAPGSTNNDGVVDTAEYTIWADHFGDTRASSIGVNQSVAPAAETESTPVVAPSARTLAAQKRAERLEARRHVRLQRRAVRQARRAARSN